MKKYEHITFTSVSYGTTTTMTADNVDMTYSELVELFRHFSAACGYQQSTVEEYLGEP